MAKYLGEDGLKELISLLKNYVNEEISSLDLDLFIVVTTLPTTGVANKIYLVPAGTIENQNIYAEYIWVSDDWEKLGEVQIEVDLSNYYTKDETYSKSEIDSTVADLESEMSELSGGAVSTVNASGTSPLTLSASKSGTTVDITGSVDLSDYTTSSQLKEELSTYATKDDVDAVETEVATKQDKLTAGDNVNISSSNVISVDIPATPSLSELGGVGTINASGTSPLTLSASKSDTTVTISGSVDLSDYVTSDSFNTATESLEDKISAKQDVLEAGSNITISGNTISATDTTYSNATTSSAGLMSASDKSTLDSLSSGAITEVTVSGSSPLTLQVTTSGNQLNITGSISASSASANGYMSSTQYTQLANLVDDPLQYADEITASDVDTIWDSVS